MLIFRHYNTDSIINPYHVMNYDETAREFIELGLRIGFRDALRLYNLRRGTANEVDSKCKHPYYRLNTHAVR
jgi:hypothetical protein